VPSDALSPDSVPRRARDAAWRDVAGEMVVLDVRGRRMRGLNPSGGRVWALLDGERSVAAIAGLLAAETGADQARVLVDVTGFIARLRELGLVEI
jgi:hypothetical protein